MSANITAAITAWQQVQHLLPADVNTAIKQRVAAWQKRPAVTAVTQPTTTPALLVMRPGTIPRPIDPFFFEVINH